MYALGLFTQELAWGSFWGLPLLESFLFFLGGTISSLCSGGVRCQLPVREMNVAAMLSGLVCRGTGLGRGPGQGIEEGKAVSATGSEASACREAEGRLRWRVAGKSGPLSPRGLPGAKPGVG